MATAVNHDNSTNWPGSPGWTGDSLAAAAGLPHPEGDLPHHRAHVSDDRLTCDRDLPLRDYRLHALRQIDIDARAKPDHSDAFARAHACALTNESDNPARDQAGDLHHGNAIRASRNDEGVAFVVLARLVEIRIDKGPRLVNDFLDPAGHRTAVDVTIENAHEDRHPRHRPVADAELGRRHRVDDLAHTAVRGRHEQALAHRRDAIGIAKEQGAPDGEHRSEPPGRRPQPEQNEAHQRKAADEWKPFPVHRHDLAADRGKDGHDHSAAPADSIAADATAPSTGGGLRLGAAEASPICASFSPAAFASRWRFPRLA